MNAKAEALAYLRSNGNGKSNGKSRSKSEIQRFLHSAAR